MEAKKAPVVSFTPKRDMYERRAYAARRAGAAIARLSRVAASGSPEEKNRALRWMKLWIAFAVSRHG